ncbi:MAG: dihydrolipoyl dehydrogenase [Bacteroidales bacterium]|nr:dihydrolipoyl dehydrogenase [Bacteroidales bacterium]
MKITIIGAGPGGYETALAAAGKGVEVVLVSEGPLGGTCLNEGCIPTKSLCHVAEIKDAMEGAESLGIAASVSGIDMGKVQERKERIVSQLRGGVESLMKHRLITLVYGKGWLKDGHTVLVETAEGTREFISDAVILATGSVSASLPIEGADLCITSREILQLDRAPRRLAVIGGGVIGLEFASIFRSFGSAVTVVEFCKNILPRFDDDLSKRLKQSLSKRGIAIETSATVQRVVRTGEGLEVTYLQKGETCAVVADEVLMAVGRRPNLASLNLDEAGIDYDARGVKVNAYMQTNLPSVYAVGDLTGGMMLAHAATFQGRRALDHLLAGQPVEGAVDSIDFGIVPAAVFTRPEAAMVGRTEEECKEQGIASRSLKSFFRANGKAVSMDEPEGFCKLVVAAGDGRILGCHLFGAHAADLVQEVAALMNRQATLADFQAVIHAHPTLGEVLQAAAHSA